VKAKWWRPRNLAPTSQKWYLYIEHCSGFIEYMPALRANEFATYGFWRAKIPAGDKVPVGYGRMVQRYDIVYEGDDLFAAIGWFITPIQDNEDFESQMSKTSKG